MRPKRRGKLAATNKKTKGEEMNGRGFTLVELLVVLAVMGILLTIAIPGYAFLVNRSRLAAVTNDLVTALHLARSEAIKRGTRVTICKTSNAMAVSPACSTTANWQDGWLVFVDGSTRGVIDGDDILLRVREQISSGAVITSVNYSRYLSYFPSGGSQGSSGLANGSLKICRNNIQRDIIINRTGRPRLDSSTC